MEQNRKKEGEIVEKKIQILIKGISNQKLKS